ncbi:MAG: hypothetical protein EBX36_07575, partial [Planctomycetia bacterium]|nr:hypothetical protein [Planctomycetia bacterium]
RLTSRLLDGFDAWWQPPAAIAAVVGVAAFVVWMAGRDGAELPTAVRVVLTALRLTAVGAVIVALLDVERIAEHEIVLPSRVAVLVDSSASMALPESSRADAPSRGGRAIDLLDAGGLLEALAPRHEVSIWRFDADAEPLALLPTSAAGLNAEPGEPPAQAPAAGGWREAVVARGYETRLGEALAAVAEREPSGLLAGVIVLTDGGNNAGLDPLAAAARLARSGVAIVPLGLGSDVLPANVRVADLIVPGRVFPGDAFAVTAYLQAQGLEGERVRVELLDQPAGDDPPGDGTGRVVDTLEATLAADGELVAVRFDVPGLPTPGSRTLTVRVAAPTGDSTAGDDSQSAGIEVVDRVTRVLLMAGGPGREYQFMRSVLHRDPSFAVDVLLGTAAPGMSQDSRRIVEAFPPSDEALAEYDAVVAIDYDWQLVEPAGWSRLERWVARESGGLIVIAGGIHMDGWLGDPRSTPLRGLFPVELRRPSQLPLGPLAAEEEPMPLEFTRDGAEAEFLWLAAGGESSRVIWGEFPGIYACFPAVEPKPGATVHARVAPRGAAASEPRRVFLAGQFYGSGSVFYAGSAELWRLRIVADAAYERLVAQLVRHVSQGRLARGSQRARLLVDRDRHPVGGSVEVRLALTDENLFTATAARPPACRAVGPGGIIAPVSLAATPDRPGTLAGAFVAAREGIWRIEVDPTAGLGEEPLTRRIQVQLPDRELAHRRHRPLPPARRLVGCRRDRTGRGLARPRPARIRDGGLRRAVQAAAQHGASGRRLRLPVRRVDRPPAGETRLSVERRRDEP